MVSPFFVLKGLKYKAFAVRRSFISGFVAKKTMKRLWVCVILGLMIMVQPVYSEEVRTPEENALPAAQTSVRRIYGENVAEDIFSDLTT